MRGEQDREIHGLMTTRPRDRGRRRDRGGQVAVIRQVNLYLENVACGTAGREIDHA